MIEEEVDNDDYNEDEEKGEEKMMKIKIKKMNK